MIDGRNVLLISVVLFVLAIVGLYIPYRQSVRSRSKLPPPAETSTVQVRIMYTNEGFEPSEITVKASTTVEWINTSDTLMWVASDPHPSHTGLPGFDEHGTDADAPQSQGLVPYVYAHSAGGVYRYTFLERGTWHYHNHLDPSDRGLVIVE